MSGGRSYASAASRLAMERAWDVARRIGRFGYAELADAAGLSQDMAAHTARQWRTEGRVVEVKGGRHARLILEVHPDHVAAPAAPVAGERRSPALNMWSAMRKLGMAFTPIDIAAHSDTPDVPVSERDARGYCQALAAAGYLRVVTGAVPGQREPRYRLLKNTGPKAPVVKRVRSVLDPNLQTVLPIAGDVQWP